MLNGEPIGYAQSYVALGSGDGWWEEETDPGVRGIDQSLANASQLGKGLPEPSWFEHWLSCCSMIPRSPRSKRTRRRATCERSDATKAGFEGQGTVTTQMVQPCTWFKHARHSSEHAVMPNPSIEGTSKGWRPWPPLMSNVRPL